MPSIIVYGNHEESSTLISYAEFSQSYIFKHTDVYDTFSMLSVLLRQMCPIAHSGYIKNPPSPI